MIDTLQKRAAALLEGTVLPDGTVAAADRSALLELYAYPAGDEPPPPTGPPPGTAVAGPGFILYLPGSGMLFPPEGSRRG